MIQKLIQKLSKASPLTRLIAALGSLVVTFLVISFFTLSFTFAAAILVSLAIHELCHLIAFRKYGVRSGIIFLVIMAVTYPIDIKEDQNPVELVTKMFWIYPAGIIGNLALGFICLALGNGLGIWYLVAWVNFLIVLLNLAPASVFDGGKIVHTVTHLFEGKREEKAIWTIAVAELLAIFGTIQFMNLGIVPSFLGILTVLFFGMDLFAKLLTNRYKDKLSPTEGGLSNKEALKWSQVYFILVLASLVGLFIIPTAV